MKLLIKTIILLAGLALALAIVMPVTENFTNFDIDSLAFHASETINDIKERLK